MFSSAPPPSPYQYTPLISTITHSRHASYALVGIGCWRKESGRGGGVVKHALLALLSPLFWEPPPPARRPYSSDPPARNQIMDPKRRELKRRKWSQACPPDPLSTCSFFTFPALSPPHSLFFPPSPPPTWSLPCMPLLSRPQSKCGPRHLMETLLCERGYGGRSKREEDPLDALR